MYLTTSGQGKLGESPGPPPPLPKWAEGILVVKVEHFTTIYNPGSPTKIIPANLHAAHFFNGQPSFYALTSTLL